MQNKLLMVSGLGLALAGLALMVYIAAVAWNQEAYTPVRDVGSALILVGISVQLLGLGLRGRVPS
jgi:hypothetical protein